jgi:FXSXX-COOH protein
VDDSSIAVETGLVDLTGMRLGDLRLLDDGPLAHSIRRLLEESRDQHSTVVAGYEAHI